MAVIVDLSAERLRRRGPAAPVSPRRLASGVPPVFAFDVASPETYLVAERADRLFGDLVWAPVLPAEAPGTGPTDLDALADRAHALGLPFVEPEHPGGGAAEVARVAALAVEVDRAGPFVLAATRLAYAGGFDLADTDVLLEAAAAAGLDPGAALAAATDRRRDVALADATDRLRAAGVAPLPAIRVGGTWFCGEHRIDEAAFARRALA